MCRHNEKVPQGTSYRKQHQILMPEWHRLQTAPSPSHYANVGQLTCFDNRNRQDERITQTVPTIMRHKALKKPRHRRVAMLQK